MRKVKHFTKICIKSSLLCLAIFSTASSYAHETKSVNNKPSIQLKKVNQLQARKLVRSLLSERGFTKQIMPGGAQIRSVESTGDYWTVKLVLRQTSAANVKPATVFVSKYSGQIHETTPQSIERFADKN